MPCHHPFTPIDPSTPIGCHTLPFNHPCICTKIYPDLTSHNPPRIPPTFLFPNQFPRHSRGKKQEKNVKNKKTMKTNNNMTLRIKWHDHALDIKKMKIKCKKIKKIPKAQD